VIVLAPGIDGAELRRHLGDLLPHVSVGSRWFPKRQPRAGNTRHVMTVLKVEAGYVWVRGRCQQIRRVPQERFGPHGVYAPLREVA
jgi:hypothetical protein